jgi:hypothetical protein
VTSRLRGLGHVVEIDLLVFLFGTVDDAADIGVDEGDWLSVRHLGALQLAIFTPAPGLFRTVLHLVLDAHAELAAGEI